MPLMSYGEYAQHRGCSRPNISQAVKRGLIKPVFIGGKPKIDSDRADAEWAANAKPTMLAKQHLAELLANREAVAECSKTDRYRREVCRVLIGGADAGLEQIRAGMAWCFRRYAKELPPDRRQQYTDMEAQAKEERRGLWTHGEPVPPWDWRAKRKGGGTP